MINRQFNAAAQFVNIEQQQINDGSSANFAGENFAGEKFFTEKSFTEEIPEEIPQDIRDAFNQLGWRGPMGDVESAWRKDPERVRQWLWYAKKKGLTGALLRTVLRNDGEYPPELDPGSPKSIRRYIEGPYAEFIEH